MVEPLFLAADEGGGKPFPVRENCRVTPLIESAEMYTLLEREFLAAEKFVWLAFRVFDPSTKLRSKEAREAGHDIWLDLIEATVRRGVEVRILLTDFEPVMADYLHAESWASFHELQKRMEGLGEERRSLFQMIVIQHEGEIGIGWRQILRFGLRRKLRKVITELLGRDKDSGNIFEIRPGLWRWLKWDGDKPKHWKPGALPRLWPATYHQKCVIIDGEKTIVGGLDLDERRWDDSRHRQRASESWHDLSALVEGSLAGDAACHFVSLWNRAVPRFREIVGEWTDGAAHDLAVDPLTEIVVDLAEAPAGSGSAKIGDASTQLVRTCSRHSGRFFATGPLPDIRELKLAHKRIIESARRCLYIEAQFFRSKEAAKWVIKALRRNPELTVIILVANVPEEIAFLGQNRHPVHKHGEHLQARALSRILKAGGPKRVGLFTLVKPEKADPSEEQFTDDRGVAYGSGVIHIHAKLLIADRQSCLISSANINGRSFEWDTELGFLWNQPGDRIGEFRRRLWQQLFGGALPDDLSLEDWHHEAEHNRTARPEDRHGFVVPYQRSRARRYGNPYFWIPDRLV